MATCIEVLLFSDTHIGFDHPPSNRATKNRRRGPDFFHNFKCIIDEALNRKVDYVIHCGDVFEKPNVPPFLVDQTYQEFLRIAEAGIPLIVVPGNHERSILPPSLFLNHPNIYQFSRPETFSFPGLSISGFPYFKGDIRSRFPEFRKAMEQKLKPADFNILCVHHAIDGVKAGDQFFEFRNRQDTLDIRDLPGSFDLILSGHIHKHQVLSALNSEGNPVDVIYSGSTERTMFDEINEIKGFNLLSLADKTYEHKFLPVRTRPMHRIDLRCEQLETNEVSGYLTNEMKAFAKDSIVQIQAEDEQILYELSKLKTKGFFTQSMNITIAGFSSLHRRKSD